MKYLRLDYALVLHLPDGAPLIEISAVLPPCLQDSRQRGLLLEGLRNALMDAAIESRPKSVEVVSIKPTAIAE